MYLFVKIVVSSIINVMFLVSHISVPFSFCHICLIKWFFIWFVQVGSVLEKQIKCYIKHHRPQLLGNEAGNYLFLVSIIH